MRNVTDRNIKDIFLQHGFKEKPQADGAYNLNPYVFDAARALLEFAARAPVPPAGDVEVLGYKHVTRTGYEVVTEKDHPPVIPGAVWIKAIALTDCAHAVWAQADAAEADGHFQEESAKFEAHVTRLTAERDGLKASAKTWQESADSHHLKLVHTQIERDALQSELTKARQLLNEASGKLYVDTQLKLRIAAALAHQSAPAAKGYPECSGVPNDCPENEGHGCGCSAEVLP